MLQHYLKKSFFLIFLVTINHADIALMNISYIKSFTKNILLSEPSPKKKIEIPIYKKKILDAGYSFEEHKIKTEDGYILTAWRIPKKINEKNNPNQKKKPIILQHGLIDSSYTWLILDKENSLPFTLVDNGYDVWLTNTRGNAVCYEHENNEEFDSSDAYSKYWDFSFHEMAIYDLPANVNYIKMVSGFDKVSYISHSQGGLIYFIFYTINPSFIENNIEFFFSLGTVVTTYTSNSKLIKYGSYFKMSDFLDFIHIKNNFVFNMEFYNIIGKFCKFFSSTCYFFVNFIISNGYNTHRINIKKLFSEFLFAPAGTSAKNLSHWNQIYLRKKLAQYDYGKKKNLEIYGKEEPPEYNLTEFVNYKVKTILYISDKDPFSNLDDLNHLFKYLNNSNVKIKKMENYNHLDFLWSDDAKADIYDEIVKVLDNGKIE